MLEKFLALHFKTYNNLSKTYNNQQVSNNGCYNPPAMELKIEHRQTSNYTVTVPVFEGPLDLLLQLIEHAELDITSVSLAMVTDQYLSYIHQIPDIAANEISAFLVIAAKLIQIKSEALLPRPPSREANAEDPGTSLIHQLQIYKQFKEIANWLQDREVNGLRTYLHIASPPKLELHFDISDITVDDLFLAAFDIFQNEQEKQNLDKIIKAPRITIREKIALISSHLTKGRLTSFNEILGKSTSRLEIVVTFLALLELIKRYRVSAQQDLLFSDIKIEPITEFNDTDEFEIEFGE
jgi:segregation and condensation protein A